VPLILMQEMCIADQACLRTQHNASSSIEVVFTQGMLSRQSTIRSLYRSKELRAARRRNNLAMGDAVLAKKMPAQYGFL